MLRKIQLFKDGIDFFEVIERIDGSRVFHEAARLRDYGLSAGQMRDGTQDLFPAFLQWKRLKKSFQAGLVLDIEDVLDGCNLFSRQLDAIDDSTEEIDAAEIDLKSLDARALDVFHGNQKDLDIGCFCGTAVVLDPDLSKFPLPPAFRFLEAQNFTRVKQPDRFRCGRKSRRHGFCNKRCEFR